MWLNIAIYKIAKDPTKTTCPFGTFENTTIGHAKRICEHHAKRLGLIPKKWQRLRAGVYKQALTHPQTQANYKLQISRQIH